MSDGPWTPSIDRIGLRHTVWKRINSNWAGSRYLHFAVSGKPLKFWTKRGAQRFADRLNEEIKGGHHE